jgi:polyisoprenoid-binding protein YceI
MLRKYEETPMKKFAAGLAAAVVLAVSAGAMSAQAKDWKIDPAHSEADFSIKHMAISTVHGQVRSGQRGEVGC